MIVYGYRDQEERIATIKSASPEKQLLWFKQSVLNGDLESIAAFLEAGFINCVFDDNGNTPLLVAVFKRNTKILELLLENGVDLDQADKKGTTPLLLAVSKGLSLPTSLKFSILLYFSKRSRYERAMDSGTIF
jgi:ankyrin repeat protein